MSKEIEINVEVKPATTKKETHIAIVMDRSGSMGNKIDAAIETVNKQLKTIRKNAKKGGKTYVTLILFDDEINVVYDRKPISKVRNITREIYYPGGMTALRDATVKAIKLLKKHRKDDVNQGFLVMVVTDGMENCSEISERDFEKKMKKIQKSKKWTMTYLLDGYSEREIREMAIRINVPVGNFASYTSTVKGLRNAGTTTANSVDNYFSAREVGVSECSTFYNADAAQLTSLGEGDDVAEVDIVSGDAPKQTTTTGK